MVWYFRGRELYDALLLLKEIWYWLLPPKNQNQVKGFQNMKELLATSSWCQAKLRKAERNGLILVKLKQKLSCYGYVRFEPARSDLIYEVLRFLKRNNCFYEDVTKINNNFKGLINFYGQVSSGVSTTNLTV